MHLMYTLDKDGNRIYTLKKVTAEGAITKSAHPARFSPDDKYSRHRVTLKKRYGVLMTQQECKPWWTWPVEEKLADVFKSFGTGLQHNDTILRSALIGIIFNYFQLVLVLSWILSAWITWGSNDSNTGAQRTDQTKSPLELTLTKSPLVYSSSVCWAPVFVDPPSLCPNFFCIPSPQPHYPSPINYVKSVYCTYRQTKCWSQMKIEQMKKNEKIVQNN